MNIFFNNKTLLKQILVFDSYFRDITYSNEQTLENHKTYLIHFSAHSNDLEILIPLKHCFKFPHAKGAECFGLQIQSAFDKKI
jgi:hypothetical protein